MKIIVIGAIAAGMSVAAKAQRVNKDAEITVIEKEDYVSFGACGLPYYVGEQFADASNMFARTPEQIRNSGINLLLQHEVTNVDFTNHTVIAKNLTTNTSEKLTYDRLMIATGAMPIVPPIEGIHADNMYTITRLAETEKLKAALPKYETIGIVGGGFIGLEMADQLVAMGKKVHLFEKESHVMAKVFDEDILEKIESVLIEDKVQLHLGEGLKSLINDQKLIHTIVTDKAEYKVDAVIVAAGFRPNTQIFDDSRLKKLENGAIIIDEFGRTSIEDVFSAGDCASVPSTLLGDIYVPLATSANKLGRIIGTNIVSEKENFESYLGTLQSSQIKVGNFEAGSTGINTKQAEILGIDFKTVTVETNNHSNYYPNQSLITIKLIYEAESNKLLGAQVFGKDSAVLRLTGLTTAIYAGLTTKELGFIDYAYAPPFASTWEALNVAGNAAK